MGSLIYMYSHAYVDCAYVLNLQKGVLYVYVLYMCVHQIIQLQGYVTHWPIATDSKFGVLINVLIVHSRWICSFLRNVVAFLQICKIGCMHKISSSLKIWSRNYTYTQTIILDACWCQSNYSVPLSQLVTQ